MPAADDVEHVHQEARRGRVRGVSDQDQGAAVVLQRGVGVRAPGLDQMPR